MTDTDDVLVALQRDNEYLRDLIRVASKYIVFPMTWQCWECESVFLGTWYPSCDNCEATCSLIGSTNERGRELLSRHADWQAIEAIRKFKNETEQ